MERTRKATRFAVLDDLLTVVCASYGASYTGCIVHPYFGDLFTAVRGIKVYRAVSCAELCIALRDTFTSDVNPTIDVPIPVPENVRILDV